VDPEWSWIAGLREEARRERMTLSDEEHREWLDLRRRMEEGSGNRWTTFIWRALERMVSAYENVDVSEWV
jgi:hypothetical protein